MARIQREELHSPPRIGIDPCTISIADSVQFHIADDSNPVEAFESLNTLGANYFTRRPRRWAPGELCCERLQETGRRTTPEPLGDGSAPERGRNAQGYERGETNGRMMARVAGYVAQRTTISIDHVTATPTPCRRDFLSLA
jgi:hypothetical protein